jgi:hypothetical protein
MTDQSGLYLLAIFRLDEITFDAQKMRLLEAYFYPHDQERKRFLHEQLLSEDMSGLTPTEQRIARLGRAVSGMYSLMPVLRDNFKGPAFDRGYPELYPVFKELADGEVVVGEHTRPKADCALAPDLKSVP